MRIEACSWKGEAGTALVHDEQRAEFFRQYANIACEQGILRLCFLDLGEQAVAMQIAVQSAGALWLLKIGYDPAFSAASPGMLLMRETIRYSVEQGLARYEFLGKSEAWTDVWTKEKHECVSVQIYPFRPRGMLALGLNGAASLTQALKRRRRSGN
jgi:CelD/BcsL family acetyltransferase involved in cellulose biosynthesis